MEQFPYTRHSLVRHNSIVIHQVAWLDQNSFPLTFEDHRVIDDTRFSIVRPFLKEWNLHIADVRPKDRGAYRCTVNTQPVRSKIVMLHVKGLLPLVTIDSDCLYITSE